jgi:hypothetical protein
MKINKLFLVVLLSLVACAPNLVDQRNITVNNTGPATYQVKNFVERSNIDKRQKLFDNPAQVLKSL